MRDSTWLRPLRLVSFCLMAYFACATWSGDLMPSWRIVHPASAEADWPPHFGRFCSRWESSLGSGPFARAAHEYQLTGLSSLILSAIAGAALYFLPKPSRRPATVKPALTSARLRRWTAISSIACLALTLLWLRSYHAGDYLWLSTRWTLRDFYSECGALHYQRQNFPEPAYIDDGLTTIPNPANFYPTNDDGIPTCPQFQWQAGPNNTLHWSFPFWPLVLLTLPLPLLWIARFGLPTWTTTALAATVALWPMVIALLRVGPITFENLFGVTILSACLGAFAIGVRDVIWNIIKDRRKPWPWQFHKRQAYYRQHHGLCLQCGYDLRGTPGRCPECGATPPVPSK